MVAVVAGIGSGLERSSAYVLGSQGETGSASLGRAGDNVFVNAANGSLVDQNTDEMLFGVGLADIISRTYNSSGSISANGWQFNDQRTVTGLTGTVNTAGSTITHVAADGSKVVYTYQTTGAYAGSYLGNENGGAYDTLKFSSSANTWTWKDGKTAVTDVYDGAHSNRLSSSVDADGNHLSYTYNGSGQLTQVATATSTHTEFTTLNYTGSNLTSVVTTYYDAASGTTKTLTRVTYGYTGSLLTSVTVDLSPGDNSTSDGAKYVTTYGYTAGGLVNSITQTDGSSLAITYDTSNRVKTLTQTSSSGVTRVSNFDYSVPGQTTVTDPLSIKTTLFYDASGQLTAIANDTTGLNLTSHFTYDSMGDVLTVQTPDGKTTTYTYDGSGNRLSAVDGAGNTTKWAYDSNNQLTSMTRYLVPDTGSGPSSPVTTWYAYDNYDHLQFVVSSTGDVTQYVYNNLGQQTAAIQYAGNAYNTSSLTASSVLTTTQMSTWVSGIGDLSNTKRVDTTYDFRGNVATVTAYTKTLTSGLGDTSSPYSQTTYVYDQFGKLLSKQPMGSATAQVYTYDGLGRMLTASDLAGNVTSTVFNDSSSQTVVTLANGLVETSTYDLAGELITYQVTGNDPTHIADGSAIATETTTYTYDADGRPMVKTDALGQKTYYLYDTAGRKVADVLADGAITEYVYDANSRVIETIAYATKLTSTQLSALASAGPTAPVSLSSVRPGAGATDKVNWSIYDAAGRVIETIDPTGAATVYAYDGASRLVSTTHYADVLASPAIIFASAGSYATWTTSGGRLVGGGNLGSPGAGWTYVATGDFEGDGSTDLLFRYTDGTLATWRTNGSQILTGGGTLGNPGASYALVGEGDFNGDGKTDLLFYNSSTNSYSTWDVSGASLIGGGNLGSPGSGWAFKGVGDFNGDGKSDILFYNSSTNSYSTWALNDTTIITGGGSLGSPGTGWTYAGTGDFNGDGKSDLLFYNSSTNAYATWDISGTSLIGGGNLGSPGTGYTLAGIASLEGGHHSGLIFYNSSSNSYSTWTLNDTAITGGGSLGSPGTGWTYAGVSADTTLTALRAVPPTSLVLPSPRAATDQVTRNFYDNNGELVGVLDAAGYLTQYVYDDAGQKVTEIRYAGATSAGLRASGTFSALLGSITTGSSDRRTDYVYDEAGQLRYTLDANARPTEYAYDSQGNLLHKTEYATSIATSASYSLAYVQAHLSTSTSDRTTRFAYDADNRLAFTIDAMGGASALTYDSMGHVIKTVQYATTYSVAGDQSLATLQSWASGVAGSLDRVSRSYYDLAGRLAYTVDGESYVVGYVYNLDNQLTSKTLYARSYDGYFNDSANIANAKSWTQSSSGQATTTYGYDTAGRLTDVTDPLGIQTHMVLDAFGQVLTSTVAYGASDAATTAFTYDGVGRVISRTDAAGTPEASTSRFIYDGLGNLLYATDGRGTTTTRTYDALGHVLTVSAPLDGVRNAVTTNQYDAFGDVVATTDPRGNTGYFYYDLLGRQVLQVDPEGYATQTSYSIGNQVTQVIRRAGRTTGTPTVTTPPTIVTGSGDETTAINRDLLDRVSSTVDANNAGAASTRSFGYDAFGDQTSVTNQLGGVTINTYDRRGLLVRVDLPITTTTQAGNVTATTVSTVYTYDAAGNRTQIAEAYNLSEQRTTSYIYDLDNRLTSSSVSGGVPSTSITLQTLTYDSRGNVIESDDANGARTLTWYDHLNRKIAQANALGALTTWTYDADGNALTQTVYGDFITLPSTPGGALPSPVNPANFRQTTYAYDLKNRLVSSTVTGVLIGAWNGTSYQTSTGNVVTQTGYDDDGNIISTTDPNGAVTYTYYDKLGRRIGQVDAGGYYTKWDLDQEGNVLTETRYATALTAGFPTPPKSGATTLPTATTNAADRITTFTYDHNGHRLTETRLNVDYASINASTGAMTTGTTSATVTYTYNGLGEVLTKSEATGDTTTYTYDSEGRQTSVAGPSFTDQTGTLVQQVTQEYYDGLGNVTRTTVGNAGAATRVTTYTYGLDGRMATSTDADGYIKTYTYDAAGNLTMVGFNPQTSGSNFAIQAVVYTYDALGRRVSQGTASNNYSQTWTYGDISQTQYDAYGEISATGMNGLWQETYGYDGAGRLIKSTAGDGVTKFFVNDAAGNQTLAITSAGTSLASDTQASALARLTNNGANAVGAVFVTGVNATITTYDARGEALAVIEPQRETTTVGTGTTITTSKAYNAFGEVTKQFDARNYETDFTYNTIGKLTSQQNPSVSVTAENGGQSNVTPTTYDYYDLSGRLVAAKDANLNLTTRVLLAGTGYGGSDAKETLEFHPDGGRVTWGYDVFGDQRTWLNEVGYTSSNPTAYTEYRTYDAMDRLITVQHAQTASGSTLTDNYVYDGLGEKIGHWNSYYGQGNGETTAYDSQGRVVQETTFYGSTYYAYAWNGSLATSGLGTFGGWSKTVTAVSGTVETFTTDYFGRTLSDALAASTYTQSQLVYSPYTLTFNYDAAGRRSSQTGSGSSTQSVTYTYFNTGLVAAMADNSGNPPSTISGGSTLNPPDLFVSSSSIYGYDVAGNRTIEKFSHVMRHYTYAGSNIWTGSNVTIQNENATATYDGMNRMLTESDTGLNGTAPISVSWEYDAVGNIRHMLSTYRQIAANQTISSTNTTQDYWYKYDSMNRFVLTKGTFTGTRGTTGVIKRGYTGNDISYDASGRRTVETSTSVSGSQDKVHSEFYTYSDDGYLTEVDIAENLTTLGAGTGQSTGTHVRRVVNTRDDLGEITQYSEYLSDGVTVEYSRTDSYNGYGISEEDTSTRQTNGTVITNKTTYYYFDPVAGGTQDVGAPTESSTYTYTNGTFSNSSSSFNYYTWFNGAPLQTSIVNHPIGGQGTTYTTTFTNDGNGHLIFANIQDGRPRTVAYTDDATGQVMVRKEASTGSSTNPMELYYYFNGVRIGDVGNNGPSNTDYGAAIANRTANTSGPFFGGSSVSAADFDQSYDPIYPSSTGEAGTASSYTVRDGDTLQSVANAVWGDSSLWYLIADANGLSSADTLVAGQALSIPNQVANVHNNASTFRPYDPNKALGNVQPTTPAPDKPGCGILGAIIVAIIAIVIQFIPGVREVFDQYIANFLFNTTSLSIPSIASITPTLTTIALAPIGDAIGQGIAIAAGAQQGFSLKEVGLSFLTATVSAGLKAIPVVQDVEKAISDGVGTVVSGSSTISTLGRTVGNFAAAGFDHSLSSAVTQGIAVAAGLQSQYSWASVAAAGIEGGITSLVSGPIDAAFGVSQNSQDFLPANPNGFVATALTGMAAGLGGAGVRSLISGEDFETSFRGELPNIIASTVGTAVAGDQTEATVSLGAGFASLLGGIDNVGSQIFDAVGGLLRDTVREIGDVAGDLGSFFSDSALAKPQPQASFGGAPIAGLFGGRAVLNVGRKYIGNSDTSWAFTRAASPDKTPETINLSYLSGTFDSLMAQSFPNGNPLEDGGTFAGGPMGDINVVNIGGLHRAAGRFTPDLTLHGIYSSDEILGTFHTHPYTALRDGYNYTHVSMSTLDVVTQVDSGMNFTVVQSGDEQFLLLSTQETKGWANPTEIQALGYKLTKQYNPQGKEDIATFAATAQRVTIALAKKFGMAYYTGHNGVFHRVYP